MLDISKKQMQFEAFLKSTTKKTTLFQGVAFWTHQGKEFCVILFGNCGLDISLGLIKEQIFIEKANF